TPCDATTVQRARGKISGRDGYELMPARCRGRDQRRHERRITELASEIVAPAVRLSVDGQRARELLPDGKRDSDWWLSAGSRPCRVAATAGSAQERGRDNRRPRPSDGARLNVRRKRHSDSPRDGERPSIVWRRSPPSKRIMFIVS